MSYSDECVNQVIGVVMAFASGLFFTANSFVIKGIGLSFGEVSAIRSVIQTVLMAGIILANGISLQSDTWLEWIESKNHTLFSYFQMFKRNEKENIKLLFLFCYL